MKTLLTTILLSASLTATAAMASPRFEGHNMRTISSEDRIQLITDRMTEQGMTADQIQSQIDTIQTRIESQNDHMQNQESAQERVINMQDRMQNMDHAKFSSLSEEERIAKITERMTGQGYSQDEIDTKITEISANWAQQ